MALMLDDNNHPDPMDEAQRMINPMMGDVNVAVLCRELRRDGRWALDESERYEGIEGIVHLTTANVLGALASAFDAASMPGAKV